MAHPRDAVAVHLGNFFLQKHHFEHEQQIAANVIYKRNTPQGTVERIVVKYARRNNENQGILEEEDILRSLWGAEHIIQLLSIVRNEYHNKPKWQEPFARSIEILNPIFPWKLRIDRNRFPEARRTRFFMMEYLPRGTAEQLVERCDALQVDEISEPLLWYFFLCLSRACIAMAYPPRGGVRDPPRILRETAPPHGQPPSLLCHYDLHMGNVMFGELGDPEDTPVCHQVTPVLKVIDFGMAEYENSAKNSIGYNIRYTGELMYQLAIVDTPIFPDDPEREKYMVTDDTEWGDYETYATRDFCRDPRLSLIFRHTVARCMAVEFDDRPSLRRLLNICIDQVGMTPNWRNLADEANELFDIVPTSGGVHDDYVTESEGSGGSDSDANDDYDRQFVLRSEVRPPGNNSPSGSGGGSPGGSPGGSGGGSPGGSGGGSPGGSGGGSPDGSGGGSSGGSSGGSGGGSPGGSGGGSPSSSWSRSPRSSSNSG
ncbi:hypothetical protein F5B18DRAFT_120427 [Nemania serpens]|nr:hypothetical protein F5B18DRAFT_120427 [Nemania serpens]